MDFDSRKAIKAFKNQFPHLPYTIAQNTSRGRHYFFKYPENKHIPCITGLFDDVDLKAEGGLIILSPSIHRNGNKYTWIRGKNLLKEGIEKLRALPSDFIENVIKQNNSGYAQESKKFRSESLKNVPIGKRNETLFKHMCSLFSKGLTKDEVSILAYGINKRWDNPLSKSEVGRALNSAAKYKRPDRTTNGSKNNSRVYSGENLPLGINLRQLLWKNIPEPQWAIKGLLCEGLNILGGKPKAGKSYLALNLCVSIAYGIPALDHFETEKGTAIYLALEDSQGRLQRRAQDMIPGLLTYASEKLWFFTDWPRMDDGGIQQLKNEMDKHKDLRLVVIDVLQHFRPARNNNNANIYAVDTNDLKRIKDLSQEYGVSILVVHHLRKTQSNDVFEDFSGSFGITGVADGIIALYKKVNQNVLQITGRDVEENKYELQFSPIFQKWEYVGDARDRMPSNKRQQLLDAIKFAGRPISPKEIEKITGIDIGYIYKNVGKLAESNHIKKIDRGQYVYIKEG